MDVDFDTPVRPHDKVRGARVKWRHEAFGDMVGWYAASEPTQAHSIAGHSVDDPHKWFLLVAETEAWFRHKYTGAAIPPSEGMWIPLDRVLID